MNRRIGSVLVLSLFALGACAAPDGSNATIETQDQQASYGIGLQMGGQLGPAQSHIDLPALLAGIKDGMEGNDPQVEQEALQTALQALTEAVRAEETARMAEAAEKNMAEGEAFLAENLTKDGIMVTESGLQYEIIRAGEGATPGPDAQVSIHYKGTLIDGTQFDSSYDRGQPAQFSTGGVIPGFSEGLQLMAPGSHYRFYIPSDLGYGPQGTQGDIGPNATLIFEVEMLEIM